MNAAQLMAILAEVPPYTPVYLRWAPEESLRGITEDIRHTQSDWGRSPNHHTPYLLIETTEVKDPGDPRFSKAEILWKFGVRHG